MKTDQKPSELINQAITNLMAEEDSTELRLELWECMKKASAIEIKKQFNR